MRVILLSMLLHLCIGISQALAWGQDGHSIIAEVAQRRLTPEASTSVARILGRNHSLASVASWADDVRASRPETYNWHFVDIPISSSVFDQHQACEPDDAATKGDCVIAELARLKHTLRCEKDEAALVDALRFAVHFVGDVHQPLHTVADARGGNDIRVDVVTRGLTCTGQCTPKHENATFHAAWDSILIQRTVWDWGAYVDRLESGWLSSSQAEPIEESVDPVEWAMQAHGDAQAVWAALRADHVIDDAYYDVALPVLDRQLGSAGLHLAGFLNGAFAPGACAP